MERKNLVLFPATYCYQQVNVPPPPILYYYGQDQYQQCQQPPSHSARYLPHYGYPPQITPTNNTHLTCSYSGYDMNNQDYNIQKGTSNYMQYPETSYQMQQKENEGNYVNGNGEDEWMQNDQFTLNNSFYSHQNNFKSSFNSNHKSNSAALISTSIVIQERQTNTSFEEEVQQTKQSQKSRISHKVIEQVSIGNSQEQLQQAKRVTASWRLIDFKGNYDRSQHIPLILKQNNIQPKDQSEQLMKMQPDDLSDRAKNDNQPMMKKCKEEAAEDQIIKNQQMSLSKSITSQTKEDENALQEGQLSGNLCKNLMRAFNKFIQNYEFKESSIQVSLNRFLERNTYSNLQMLKIYHNPRYKQIFLEFVKEGALKWLQQSKVKDINAHISLLQKIIQGNVSQIGIKKRKNVSKIITTNIKKKSIPTKKD